MAEPARAAREGAGPTISPHRAAPAAAFAVDLSPRGERLQALVELARNGPAAVAQRQRMRGLFGAPPRAAAPVQRRVLTFGDEVKDPEVAYSVSAIRKAEGDLAHVDYGARGTMKPDEKEIFVGHSAGPTLGARTPEEIAPELAAGMDKAKQYNFVVAACKTGQEADGFARKLNVLLAAQGMTQHVTAPKNALTVVNKDIFLQAEGLDPWQHPGFGNYFKEHWLVVLRNVFRQSVEPTIATYQGPIQKAAGAEILKSAKGLALAAFFAEDWAKPAVKGFTTAPAETQSKNLYEMGSRLLKLIEAFDRLNDVTKLEQRVRKWLAMGICEAGPFLTTLAAERERVTTAALQNFLRELGPDDRAKIKQYTRLGGDLLNDDGWYKELKSGAG